MANRTCIHNLTTSFDGKSRRIRVRLARAAGVDQVQAFASDPLAAAMDGTLRDCAPGRAEALLPSPQVQNHAAFLSWRAGALDCLWFAGSLEGRADISVHRATLGPGGLGAGGTGLRRPRDVGAEPGAVRRPRRPGAAVPHRPARRQPGRLPAAAARDPAGRRRDLPLPPGSFIRAPVHLREDGAWLLPLFRCASRPGQRWTGSHDTAALAISTDAGETWRQVEVPGSIGSVHMTPGAPGRRPPRRLLPPPPGRFRLPQRKRRWRRKLEPRRRRPTCPTTTRRSPRSASPTAASRWPATR